MGTTYTWTSAEKTTIKEVADDGSVRFIPTDPANTDYARIVADGIEPDPYVPPPQAREEPDLVAELQALRERIAQLEGAVIS